MRCMLVNGSFQHKLCRELPKKNLDSLVKPGNDVFFTLFLMNRQLAMLIATQSPSRRMTKPEFINRL